MSRGVIVVFLLANLWWNVAAQERSQQDRPWQVDSTSITNFNHNVNFDQFSKSAPSNSTIPLMPGWPIKVGRWPQFPVTADLDADGMKEVIIADRDGWLHILRLDGQYYSSAWPKKLGGDISSPAIADINNDDLLEIIVVERTTLGSDYFPNGRVHVLNSDGTYLPGWPVMLEGGHKWINSVSIADINNDGMLDIITATGCSYQHNHDPIIYYSTIYAFNYDGTLMAGWPADPDSGSGLHRMPRSPLVLVDLDGDGYLEIISGFLDADTPFDHVNPIYALRYDGTVQPGFFPIVTGVMNYALAAADMNGDGDYSIFTHGRRFRSNGFNDIDWKIQEDVVSLLAFADVDQNGSPDMIYGTSGHGGVDVVDNDGNSLPGWPITTTEARDDIVDGNPVAGDIDGDGDIEILLTSFLTNNIFAWHHDATPVEGFPITLKSNSARIAISDLDGDGDIELISACEDGWVYVWDIPSTGPCTNLEWPMYQHDERHTGVYPSIHTNAVADRPVNTPVYFTLQQNYPNPFNSETRIPYKLSGRTNITLSIVDLRGRTVALLEQGVRNAGRHEAVWNAAGVSSGVYLAQLRVGSEVRVRKVAVVK